MGGGILLVQYHSFSQLLSSVYSDFKWEKLLFSSQQTSDVWTDEGLANCLVRWLSKQSENETLYIRKVIQDMGISGAYPLTTLLKASFPQFKWINNLPKSSKKSQYMLKECIENLFVNKKKDFVLLTEYKHPDISNLELDYFLPQYSIAFEYQVKRRKWKVLIYEGSTTL